MIKEKSVDVVYGSGGPNHDSVPVYSDNKAPNGGQVIGPNGKQLMLANSSISGVHYVIVDPQLLTDVENNSNKFLSYKPDGSVNYARLWIRDNFTGHGYDYKYGVEMWIEYSHLAPYIPEQPYKLHKLTVKEIEPGVWSVTEIDV